MSMLALAHPAAPARRAAVEPPKAGSSVRLTRRGRLVACLTVTGLLIGAMLGLARAVVAATDAPRPALSTVVVRPGETLWDISRRVAPADDPRDTVIRVQRLNSLDGALILPGQQLLVPAGD